MDRRDFLKGMTAGLVLSGLAPHIALAEDRRSKPNIILILADDLSAKELSCYGGAIKTPTLDNMAAEGIIFRTAWTSPVCGPSRCLLRTGKYACHTGYYDNGVLPKTPIWKTNLEIGQAMRKAGYATATYGKLHDGGNPKDYGYDEYCCALHWDGYDGPDQGRGDTRGMYSIQWYWHPGLVANGKGVPTTESDFGPDIEVDRMLDFIRRKKDQPFFVFWPTNLPHMEFTKAGKWRYTPVPELDASGKRTGKQAPGSLESTVQYLDHLIGRIRASLDEMDLSKDTIIMFCGDNGTPGYGKHTFENEFGPRVPFVASCPGLVRKTGPSDALIDFSDVLPTLVDLAGSELPAGYKVDGRSFAPLLLGKEFKPRDYIFCQLAEGRWIRDGRWLLDGRGHFWDCGSNRDETKGHKDVTFSDDPEVIAARKRFEEVSLRYPQPDYTDPETADAWKRFRQTQKPISVYRPPYISPQASKP